MDLEERVEALTQSMELLAAMAKDTETRLEARIEELAQEQKQSEARLEGTMHRLADSMERFTDLLGKLADAMAVTAERQNRQEDQLKYHSARLDAGERSMTKLENSLTQTAGEV